MWVDFDVWGQQELDFYSGRRFIMDYRLKLKCLNDGFVSYKLVAFGSKDIKRIVHPKMKIVSSTQPLVFPNLYECVCCAEHKGRYSEECGKQSSSGEPLTSIVFFSYYGSQWCPSLTA